MELFLIDGIGPFFRGVQGRRINWSKIPFDQLPLGGGPEEMAKRFTRFDQIRIDFEAFCDRVAALGYNAVTLDDVAHLADSDLYDSETRRIIAVCREEFQALFGIARRHGLRIFLTMDVLSYTQPLMEKLGRAAESAGAFCEILLDDLLDEFDDIAGVILRIGESDGLDVKHHFRSQLVLRNSGELNRFLRVLLPVFERHRRKLVLRTWTVGAHRIGDLIWHRGTFAQSLEGIDSDAFVISMKYGESDFFRYLPLNRSFFRTRHQKIIELQARREYEGCGEFPSFIGSDYGHYAAELQGASGVIGISVWCQTGGWVPFRRLAFLDDVGSVWTELNAAVSLRIFRYGDSVEGAVRASYTGDDWVAAHELLRLSEEVVKELLYLEEFARQKLFFRRIRIPTLLSIYWNNVFINHSVRKVNRHFVEDGETSVRQGHAALLKIERMKVLAERAGLPVDDIEFMRDTFALFALAREYYFLPFDAAMPTRILEAKRLYKEKYPKGGRPRYRIKTDFEPFKVSGRTLGLVFGLFARRQRGYRVIDRILTLHLLSIGYRALRAARPKLIPKFARKSAMGIDTIFR